MVGIANRVSLKFGDWCRSVSFMVMPMDNFEVVLGQESFRNMKVVSMPHIGNMVIFFDAEPHFVLMVRRHLGSISRKTTLSMVETSA